MPNETKPENKFHPNDSLNMRAELGLIIARAVLSDEVCKQALKDIFVEVSKQNKTEN